jgi:hypothetical protein
MPYVYATQDQDYSDYSSGRVIYSLAGAPAFPVRLASEIFQRAAQHLPAPLTIFDPTCGGAYHLAALGLLHGQYIARILASDIDERVLGLARRNLGLLSLPGLEQREHEIRQMLQNYGKESHTKALASLNHLRAQLMLRRDGRPIETRVFAANALDPAALKHELGAEKVQLVLSDIPYGQLSNWQVPESSSTPGSSPAWSLLEALRPVLASPAVVAIAADKAQKLAHPAYQRIERFQVGKRQVSLLRLL